MISHLRHGTGDMSNLGWGGCAWWLAWWISPHWGQVHFNGHGTQECAGGFRSHWYPWKQEILFFFHLCILLFWLSHLFFVLVSNLTILVGLFHATFQHGWWCWRQHWDANKVRCGKHPEMQNVRWRTQTRFAEMTFGILWHAKHPSRCPQVHRLIWHVFSSSRFSIMCIHCLGLFSIHVTSKGSYVTPESGTFLSHEGGRTLTEAGQ